MANDIDRLGLSSGNIRLVTTVTFVALLIFGPIQPYGMVVRFAYLIIIPCLIFLGLRYWGNKWNMGKLSNNRFARFIIAAVAGVLLVGAAMSFSVSYHFECNQYAQDGDGGQECVGDYVRVRGSDKEGGIIQLALAGIAIWYVITKGTKVGN